MTVNRILRREFRSMGTSCSLISAGVTQPEFDLAFSRLVREANQWEAKFSRFLPGSELTRLNRSGGQSIAVSDDFLAVLEQANAACVETDGRFNPFVAQAMESAGYIDSFEMIPRDGAVRSTPDIEPDLPVGHGVLPLVEISRKRRTAQLPPGLTIDLGGIAKGAFVDRMRGIIEDWPGGIIDAGGDMAVAGAPENDDSWQIGIQFPGRPGDDIAALTLPPGPVCGIATSSTQQRRWRWDDRWQNHLIDPATGRPVELSTPNVTVVSDTTTRAEIEAKSILIALSRGESVPNFRSTLAIVADELGNYETYQPTETRAETLDAGYAAAKTT